jgi:hypothetical protein
MSDQKGLFPGTNPAARRTIQEQSPDVEVITSEPTALTLYSGNQLAQSEAPPVAALAMLENALAITERMAQVVSGLRVAAIKMTDPVDWVLSKDKQGNELSMLTASGAQKVASLYGILLEPLDGETTLEPSRGQLNGKLAFTLKCRAQSRLLGRWIEVEATRREDEEFTGRETDEKGDLKFRGGHTFEPDLKKSVRTLAITTAVRELVGLKNVSKQELDSSWLGTTKTTERCRFGHGYGTSQDRSASGVAEGDVKVKAKELGDEILRRAGGDTDLAKSILKDITINKDGKYARESVAQFTKVEQVEWAWDRLRKHPVFGDAQQRSTRESGE